MTTDQRQRYVKTRHRGLSYRERKGGLRSYYGFLHGRGRVKLQATTERAALEEFSELRGKIAKGEKIAPGNLRLSAVAEEWFESKHRLREWTRKGYRASLDNELLPRFGHLRLRDIDVEHVAKFIRALEARELSTSTINSYLRPLSGTFDFARRRGLVSVNPVRLLTPDDRPAKRAKVKAYEWSDEEIEALFAAAQTIAARPISKYDYTPILKTAVYTGLRLGELLGLQWQDVDLDGAALEVRRQLSRTGQLATSKTRKSLRRVPLTSEMVQLLRRQKESAFAKGQAKPEDFVFASKTGGPLQRRNVQGRGFESARDLAKLPQELSFHDLRHAFASICAHRGVDSRMLSEVLGHSHASTTAMYTHLYNREASEDAFKRAMSGSG